MNPRAIRAAAWAVAGLSFVLMAATLWVVWLGRSSPLRVEAELSPAYQAVAVLGNVVAPIVGALIAVKQPRNPYGWIWLASGIGLSFEQFVSAYAFHGLLIAPGRLPLADLALTLTGVGWFVYFGTGPFILLLFPTGSLPSPRWRFAARAAGAALAAGMAVVWAIPGKSGLGPDVEQYAIQGVLGGVIEAIVIICVILISITILAGVLSLVVRFRSAKGIERQQLKWFTYGAVLLGVVLVSDWVYTLPGIWESVKEGLAFNMLPPLTIGLAILRYRLYDIDVIIRRTLIYGALTGALALVYFGSVVLLQSSLRALAGQTSQLAIVLSTLAIAALFVPLRGYIQELIDRRFYRRKYDAVQTLAAFSAAARDETDLSRLTERLVSVVAETMQPAQVSLWLGQPAAGPPGGHIR